MIAQWTPFTRRTSGWLTLLMLCAGCAGNPVPGPTDAATGVRAPMPEQRAVSVALAQIGRPYRYGGSDPGGFDCSGLVQYAWTAAGVRMPRTTGGLWRALAPVRRSELQPGDVLFFIVEGKMSHVGLYVGGGDFVHAPASGRRVSMGSLDDGFYRQAFIRGGRR